MAQAIGLSFRFVIPTPKQRNLMCWSLSKPALFLANLIVSSLNWVMMALLSLKLEVLQVESPWVRKLRSGKSIY